MPQVVAQAGGGKREQAGLIKAFTAWLPSSLILFKLSHLPTLNGKLSQLLPVSLWGKQPEEGGKGGKSCRAAPGWDLQCSLMEVCAVSYVDQKSDPGKPELLLCPWHGAESCP